MACDTLIDNFFSYKQSGSSARGYKSCKYFVTEFGNFFIVKMKGKSATKIAQEIKKYFKEIGVPLHLICVLSSVVVFNG